MLMRSLIVLNIIIAASWLPKTHGTQHWLSLFAAILWTLVYWKDVNVRRKQR